MDNLHKSNLIAALKQAIANQDKVIFAVVQQKHLLETMLNNLIEATKHDRS